MKQKRVFLVFMCLLNLSRVFAQAGEEPESRAAALESEAARKDAEPEDDSYEMDLDFFRKHPADLNSATEDVLLKLHMLSIFQIRNLISYRKLLGPLINMYEIQAVPGWDLECIRNLMPYVQVVRGQSVISDIKEKWKGGDKSFILRAGQTLEKSKGYQKPISPDASYYEGNAQKVFIRYEYNYKQQLSYGFTGDKDAGEPFLKSAQRYGFDFYSFHFCLQGKGLIRTLAIGDFTVSLGQGLIQWQSMSFTKTNLPMAVKREGPVIKPYHSAGEYNFHRGIALTLQSGKWQSTGFASFQKISTNAVYDTSAREDLFSSFQQSCYHRTPSEIADRNNCGQFSLGGNLRFRTDRFQLGFNVVHFEFSRPLKKSGEPYNRYSLRGKRLSDWSTDYQFTTGNLHLFGELAVDDGFHLGMVHGSFISLGEYLDLSFLYRNISPAFQSLYSDAFTENSHPGNEKGFYTGLSWKPWNGWRADIYYDVFVFPWLKYLADAPTRGRDIMVRLNYQPGKITAISLLYKNEIKSGNRLASGEVISAMEAPVKKRWRVDMDLHLSAAVGLHARMEYLQIDREAGWPKKGFLATSAFSVRKPYISGNLGVTLFETDDYATRMYIYEPDLLYNFSLPVFYGKGIHYYINIHRDLLRTKSKEGKGFRLSAWLKWGQVFYRGVDSIGTGLDEIRGNRKSELRMQVFMQWN